MIMIPITQCERSEVIYTKQNIVFRYRDIQIRSSNICKEDIQMAVSIKIFKITIDFRHLPSSISFIGSADRKKMEAMFLTKTDFESIFDLNKIFLIFLCFQASVVSY